MVKKVFSPWKLRKQLFFAGILKIQWGARPPPYPPSDAHDPRLNPNCSPNPNANLMATLT